MTLAIGWAQVTGYRGETAGVEQMPQFEPIQPHNSHQVIRRAHFPKHGTF